MCNLKQTVSKFDKILKHNIYYKQKLNTSVPFFDAGDKAIQYMDILSRDNVSIDVVTDDMFKTPFNNIMFEHDYGIYIINKVEDENLNIIILYNIDHNDQKRNIPIIIDLSFFRDESNYPSYSINKVVYQMHNKWIDDRQILKGSILGYIKELMPGYLSLIASFLKMLNSPKIFIIEETKKLKIGNKNKKIEKIIGYHFNTARDFKLQLKQTLNPEKRECNGPLEFGHDRRGHWREFRSDWFKNKKGDKIWIDAMWVGPESFTDPKDPNKKYRVRLDL